MFPTPIVSKSDSALEWAGWHTLKALKTLGWPTLALFARVGPSSTSGTSGTILRGQDEYPGTDGTFSDIFLRRTALTSNSSQDNPLLRVIYTRNDGERPVCPPVSIASTNPVYAQALQRGAEILAKVGYFK
jgi:hypothetical protein